MNVCEEIFSSDKEFFGTFTAVRCAVADAGEKPGDTRASPILGKKNPQF